MKVYRTGRAEDGGLGIRCFTLQSAAGGEGHKRKASLTPAWPEVGLALWRLGGPQQDRPCHFSSYIPTLTGYGLNTGGHLLLVGLGRQHAVTAYHHMSFDRGLKGSQNVRGEGPLGLYSKSPSEHRGAEPDGVGSPS